MFCLSLHSLWETNKTPNPKLGLVTIALSKICGESRLHLSLLKVFITRLGVRQRLAGLCVPLRTHLNPFSLEPTF